MLQGGEEILPIAGIIRDNFSITWEDTGIKTYERPKRSATFYLLVFIYQSSPTVLVRNFINGAAILHRST